MEVENRSEKDTKTEKNGETPREKEERPVSRIKDFRKRKEAREKNT